MKLLLVGMNHRSAPLELRERLAVDEPGPVLRKLVAGDEVDEAVLISTCNRVELVVLTREIEAARLRLRSLFRRELARDAGPAERDLDASLYEYQDGDAMRHVLRVASSLASSPPLMVLPSGPLRMMRHSSSGRSPGAGPFTKSY